MKVLSHEDDVLKNGYGDELAAIKRSTTASALAWWTTSFGLRAALVQGSDGSIREPL